MLPDAFYSCRNVVTFCQPESTYKVLTFRGVPMSTFIKDIRYGVRSLWQRPGFTIIAVIALGLAIGSTSAMFSVVNAVILKPLNFDDSEKVAIIWESAPKLNFNA